MASVRIDVSLVSGNISRARREIAQQNDDLQHITNEVRFMDSAWDDTAQKAFADRYQNARTEIENFNRSLDSYLGQMQKFVHDCVDWDFRFASKLRQDVENARNARA